MAKPKAKHISNEGAFETAYMVKKLDPTTWKLVKVKIQGDTVLAREEGLENLPRIVMQNLELEICTK